MTRSSNYNSDCIFCRIIAGETPSTPIYRDEELIVIPDINPKAPVHLLLIPISHQPSSIAEMTAEQAGLIGRMAWRAKLLSEQKGISEMGYRLVFNVRKHGGQEVDHLHLHLLGGQPLGPMAKI